MSFSVQFVWAALIIAVSSFASGLLYQWIEHEYQSKEIPLSQKPFSPGLAVLLAGSLMALPVVWSTFSFAMIWLAAISAVLAVIVLVDLRYHLIPNRFVAALAILAILYAQSFAGGNLLHHIAWQSAAAGGGILGLLALLTREGIGWGDVKLAAAISLLFPLPQVLLFLMLSFLLGAIAATFLLLARKKPRHEFFAFGPFIVLSGLLTLLWGDLIVNLYLF